MDNDLSGAEEILDRTVSEKKAGRSPDRDRKKRTKSIIAIAGFVLLVLLVLNSVNQMHSIHHPDVPVEEVLDNARTTMFFMSLDLQNHLLEYGSYPDTLDPEMEAYGLDYVLETDGSYTISYHGRDTVFTFNSHQDPALLVTEELARQLHGEVQE